MPNDTEFDIDDIDDIDIDIEKITEKILKVLLVTPQITQKQLALETGLSVSTVARRLKKLRDTNVIRRVGSDRSGHWEWVK